MAESTFAPRVTIGVAGNPNCGKTTLFNALTGGRQHVGNWPGVTVEQKTGRFRHDGRQIEVVDLPGIYSLSAHSLDEQVSRDFILHRRPEVIVNIVDATNLERHLYLTAQLLEMRVPLVVALNMMDLLPRHKLKVHVDRLSELLDCPVVGMVARSGQGVDDLKGAILAQAQAQHVSDVPIHYPREVEQLIAELQPDLTPAAEDERIDPRWLAVKLIENDSRAVRVAGKLADGKLSQGRSRLEAILGDETDIVMADARYGFVHGVVQQVVTRTGIVRRTISDAIDRVVLNRVLGIPIFLVAMYITFMLAINVGAAFVDFFDILCQTVLVNGPAALLGSLDAPDWLVVVLARGVGGGIQTVATLIPPIGLLFLCLAVLEDSGYMARAAFVMDRLMRAVGLPGKAFVPLLIGFGCNVPAVMATRTLDSPRDRFATIAMTPFMSCGARLAIYAVFAAVFFAATPAVLVFGLYLIGIAAAVLTGLLLRGTLLRGRTSTFVMELPPYHVPTVRGVAIHTWLRLKDFVLKAGRVIVLVVVVMSLLASWQTDGSFSSGESNRSVLAEMGRTLVPVFQPMGIEPDNWPAAVGLATGVLAKEAVVGTLDAMYERVDQGGEAAGEPEEGFDFFAGLGEAVGTIPPNLAELPGQLLDPLGIMGVTEDPEAAAGDVGSSKRSRQIMADRFDGRNGAFAYLLFVLLYFPCVATVAAVYRESSFRWMLFVVCYQTLLAWAVAVGFYQAATFGTHPVSSSIWLGAIGAVAIMYVVVLRIIGVRLRLGRQTIGGP